MAEGKHPDSDVYGLSSFLWESNNIYLILPMISKSELEDRA